MSAKVYGNVHGIHMLIRVVYLRDTEKETIEELKSVVKEFLGAENVTVELCLNK